MIGQTEIVGFHAVDILVRRSALVEKYPAHTVMDMIRLLHRMLRQRMAVEAGPHLGKRISRRRDGLDEILKKRRVLEILMDPGAALRWNRQIPAAVLF